MTPIEAAARLTGRGRVLLHSARDDDELGARSFVAHEPIATLIARGRSLVELGPDGRPVRRSTEDPFAAADAFLARHGCVAGAAGDRTPRVVGFFGYDLARVVEQLPASAERGAGTPDLWLAAYDRVAGWNPDVDQLGLDQLPLLPRLPPVLGPLTADDDAAHHIARVERVKDYLASGDVYQVNLARRLVAKIAMPGDPLAIYAALAETSPAPYGALIEADGCTIISGSPERYLSTDGDRVETRPIKGTRPLATKAELADAPKDAAEHLMIVDLERNDLGRIARTGTVAVDRLGYVVELPTLVHKVSRVSARLKAGVGYAELLRATFPGGSITGAPKVRAMQLIAELEPAQRGPYCGAFGYFSPGGCELAIAIRVGVIANDELRVHVGGGIVADSDPAEELAETEVKAAGWRAALSRLAPR